MKKILFSVLALLAFTFGGTAQNLPSYLPANGLIGWWPFNGNANDESGNNNNGTVNGATLTADRFGNAGKAYGFDGQSSYIQVNHKNSLNAFPISVFAWIKSKNINGSRGIVCKYPFGGSNNGWSLHGNLNYLSGYYFNFPGGSVLNFDTNLGNQELLMDTTSWHLVGIICDTDSAKIFIDNELVISKVYSGNGNQSSCTNTDNLYFGQIHMNSITNFQGSLDDIAIYNRALTQQEITALYQGANTTANCPTFPASLTQGLVGYWPFCGNALDESGNNNHGTVNGATLTTDRFGLNNTAFKFPANSNIQIQDNPPLRLSDTDFSISSWVLLTDTLPTSVNYGTYSIISKRDLDNDTYDYMFGITAPSFTVPYGPGRPIFNTTNLPVGVAVAPNPIQLNQWTNLTVTYELSNGILKLFSNGILIKTQIGIPSPSATISANLWIGNDVTNQPYHFHGSLDDIAIWNRALTPQEIQQVYNQGICQTSITVTDTLLIHTGLTSYNPVAYGNTVKVWPNPGNTAITLDAGNLSSMQGWKYKVANTLGQTVVNETAINQQQTNISLSTWGGNGIYYLHLINPQGHAIEIKKIVLAP